MFQVRPLATVGAAALCLGVVLAGLGGTAGADSSGPLGTTTTVSAVPTTQPYGVPGQEFVVNVTSSAAPTGTVTVSSGTQQLCTNLVLEPGRVHRHLECDLRRHRRHPGGDRLGGRSLLP